MERIKNLEEITLRGDFILAEVMEEITPGKIIIPDTVKNGFDYLRVITVGHTIEDIKSGDILVDVAGGIDVYSVGERKIAMIPRHNVMIAVHPDNFDNGLKKRRTLQPVESISPKVKLIN